MKEAGATIEAIMESGKVKKAWDRISWWYHKATGRQLPPCREVLDQVTTERVELYRCRMAEGL